jgi:FixJ family two-component response regulator
MVLDVGLPGVDGMELHDALVHGGSTLPVVFVSGRADIPTTVRAMKAGAVDFLAKPIAAADLLRAVESAIARQVAIQARADQARDVRQRLQQLTRRQREVCDFVVKGRLNKQIAAELGTSIRTVKAHRAQVMRKMDVRSVAELVAMTKQLESGSD